MSKFADAEAALLYNAGGVGLYRTEFGFAIRGHFPTEDEQFEFLNRAAERFHPRKLTFRLLDIGGDKDLPYFPLPAAHNPLLAQRGIRLLLEHPEILKPQLRAFLRVSAQHPVQILMPMVGGVEEVRATRAVIREVERELAAEGKAFNPKTPLGAMIEVPAAALIAPALAREVDFFSLGTNDLVQYLLAADRENEGIARYYQPLHPGVLRLIALGRSTRRRQRAKPVTICGDVAGDPFYTQLLLGLGPARAQRRARRDARGQGAHPQDRPRRGARAGARGAGAGLGDRDRSAARPARRSAAAASRARLTEPPQASRQPADATRLTRAAACPGSPSPRRARARTR